MPPRTTPPAAIGTPPRCEHCRFFQAVPAHNQVGLCRRWPPIRTWVFTGLDGGLAGGPSLSLAIVPWPPVAPFDWCGEFQPHPARGRH